METPLRPIRRILENLSLKQMLELENPQKIMRWKMLFHVHRVNVDEVKNRDLKTDWHNVVVHRCAVGADLETLKSILYVSKPRCFVGDRMKIMKLHRTQL